ncbi:MAG: AAA family ATPase [Bacteroidales bacterium]|nr:AAA family ATPase [Bacteroidales bacterium]
MLSDFLRSKLQSNLEFEPTPAQEELLSLLSIYLVDPAGDHVFLIKGYAGTGKTTIVNALVRTLSEIKQKAVLLAPTGRAAKVLSAYTQMPAYTIHKKIYRQKSAKDGFGDFTLDRNLHKSTFFIVDEASMIGDKSLETSIFGSGDLLRDLLEYVQNGSNCHLIMIGDTAQLPPVGLDISPALDPKYLERQGLRVTEFFLSDIVRQALESGILENAGRIRKQITEGDISLPKIITEAYPDIISISGSDVLEEIESCYSKYGESETIIVSRTNKRANRFNTGIRNQILWREEEISAGDLLMVVKNNYFWISPEDKLDFIANGDIVRLLKIYRFEEIYGYKFADVRLGLLDYSGIEVEAKIFIDTLGIETAALSGEQQRDLFEKVILDYEEVPNRKDKVKRVKENPAFNALQVKFAYAVTCHKAQGGQWKAVFVDIGFFRQEMLSLEYLRWLYTAFTRASERLYLLNFPEEFFL